MSIIEFNKVSKRYRIQETKYRTFREDVTNLARRVVGRKPVEQDGGYIWALRDVDFAVEDGEVVGIVGPNGAGKSTILKILSQVTYPTKGTVHVGGRFIALIELGAGFHPELTGRENIYMNGIVLGMKRREIDRKFDAIVEFSELEGFIDMPVKRYSSGMFVRLAFSVMIHVDPEILFIDEVLAVGDFMFRDKCLRKMREFRDMKKTLIVVSHDRRMIENLCEKAMFLHKGRLIEFGDTQKVLNTYYKYSDKLKREEVDKRRKHGGPQKELEILEVKLMDEHGNERERFETGEKNGG